MSCLVSPVVDIAQNAGGGIQYNIENLLPDSSLQSSGYILMVASVGSCIYLDIILVFLCVCQCRDVESLVDSPSQGKLAGFFLFSSQVGV